MPRRAATAVHPGEGRKIGIAEPADIDRAVTLALGYPIGPLALGDRLGPRLVVEMLENLHAATGDLRWRTPGWLRRRAHLGMALSSDAKPAL